MNLFPDVFRSKNLPLFFISDVHLRLTDSEEERAKRKTLIQFIEHVASNQGTLFIVGDFFDFWFEYKYVIPKAYFDIISALHHVKSNGAEIYFIKGNHDYWVKDFIHDTLFTRVCPDSLTLESNGKTFFITHGDGLLSWDKGYRLLRKIIRNPFIMLIFRWIHPDLGYTFARWISKHSRHPIHTDEYNESVLAELKTFAEKKWEQGIDYVISGHYHQAKSIKKEDNTLIILGDWVTHRSFGYYDGEEFSLNYWR